MSKTKLYGGSLLKDWRNWLDNKARKQSLLKTEKGMREMITEITRLLAENKELKEAQICEHIKSIEGWCEWLGKKCEVMGLVSNCPEQALENEVKE